MSELAFNWLDDESPQDLKRWAIAATVVVGIHLAAVGGFLYVHIPGEIGDDLVVTVDLAPIDDTVDQPAIAPQPEVEEKPVEQPPPPEESQTVVAPPKEKPLEKTEEQKPPPLPPQPARSKGGTQNPVAPSWQMTVFKRLQHEKRYPADAQQRGEEGVVLLGFSVDRNGHVLEHHIAQSSGHSDLDAEVLAMIERAAPLPPFPASMSQPKLDLTVPIRFSLR